MSRYGFVNNPRLKMFKEHYPTTRSYCSSPYNPNPPWPEIALTPKKETKAWEFLQQNPTADGRGIVIAIMDTGVDPGAAGLTVTSTGQIKVIERYDCSGAGDVDTLTVVTAEMVDGKKIITGRTGRKLVVPACWNNPSGIFRVGFKPLYELYAPEVVERMVKERRETVWIPGHNHCLCVAEQKLAEFRKRQLGQTPPVESSILEKLERQNYEAEVAVLQLLDSKQEDLGPMIDCVMFKDASNNWRICLSIEADLAQCPILGEYNLTHEYCNLLPTDRFNLSVNVWENGNLLELVGCSDSHGTHVASITAAYFPSNPLLNGMAPGAQIVSLTIGDNRLACCATGTSLTRAMARVLQCPDIHLINMSYGFETDWSPGGKIVDMMREVIDEKGVVWVVAAGNEGPALTTLHAAALLDEDITIGVGSYLSPEMMIAQYAQRYVAQAQPYNFTSRGPAMDGSMCVHICAPGGATAALPTYTLESAQQFEGTSMATPNATGCIALMMSLARQRGIGWTPYSVKTSLTNTAVDYNFLDPFAKGHGLLQVPEAYEMLEYLNDKMYKIVRYNIQVSGGCPGYPMTGIYVRDPVIDGARQFRIVVQPKFFRDRTLDPQYKIHYKNNLTLTCSAPWVSCPAFIDLRTYEEAFFVRIDPELLTPGVYYTRIDANSDEPGACLQKVFSVSVTVIVPIKVVTLINGRPGINFGTSLTFPGCIRRYFVETPVGATWGVVNIRNNPRGSHADRFKVIKTCFTIHVMTPKPGSFEQAETMRTVFLDANQECDVAFEALSGRVVEIVICRENNFDNIDSIAITAQVIFHGLTIPDSEISTSTADAYRHIEISSLLAQEKVMPRICLTHQVQCLRPIDMKIQMKQGLRELMAQGKYHYELLASYEFTASKPSTATLECSMFGHTGFESNYPGQFWMVFDHNKCHLAPCLSDEYELKYDIKRPGDYTVRLAVRHENPAELYRFMTPGGEKMSRKIPTWTGDDQPIPLLPMILRLKLETDIELESFFTISEACGAIDQEDSDSHWPVALDKGHFMLCYIRTVIDPKIIEDLPGTSTMHLEGDASFCKDRTGSKMSQITIKLAIPEGSACDSPKESKAPEDTYSLISSLPPTDALVLYNALKTTDDSWEIHSAVLESLMSEITEIADEPESGLTSVLSEMIKISDIILSKLDQAQILNHFGKKSPCTEDKNFEKQRNALVKALVGKGLALVMSEPSYDSEEVPTFPNMDVLDKIYTDLMLHAEIEDEEVIDYTIEYYILRKFFALAVKQLLEKREKFFRSWSKKWDLKLRLCYVALKWNHCLFFHEDNLLVGNPPDYRLA